MSRRTETAPQTLNARTLVAELVTQCFAQQVANRRLISGARPYFSSNPEGHLREDLQEIRDLVYKHGPVIHRLMVDPAVIRTARREPETVAVAASASWWATHSRTLHGVPPHRYADIDLDRLTAYVLKILEDRRVAATFENIVVALYRLFPERFALLGYPKYPDAARANRALLPAYRSTETTFRAARELDTTSQTRGRVRRRRPPRYWKRNARRSPPNGSARVPPRGS